MHASKGLELSYYDVKCARLCLSLQHKSYDSVNRSTVACSSSVEVSLLVCRSARKVSRRRHAHLRPVSGWMIVGCVAAGCGDCCLGLVTFVLLLANSSLRVCGRSGSNLMPCYKTMIVHWSVNPRATKWVKQRLCEHLKTQSRQRQARSDLRWLVICEKSHESSDLVTVEYFNVNWRQVVAFSYVVSTTKAIIVSVSFSQEIPKNTFDCDKVKQYTAMWDFVAQKIHNKTLPYISTLKSDVGTWS